MPKRVRSNYGESSEKIILLMLDDKYITISEMAEIVRISTRAIEKQISKLKEIGIVERIDPANGGYWKIHI